MAAALSGAAAATPTAEEIDLPPGMTASYLVLDRVTGASSARDEHKQYRSASVVKVLIALDYLESHGPDYVIPADDLALLEPMLRSSDNNGASVLWVRDGWEAIINRMVAKIGLTDTAPPASRGMWGYTAISAADVVKIYQYILNTAHPKHRDFIMGNLHQTTKCSVPEKFDQSFGIPSALPRPWGVKQGWSGFGDRPAPGEECVEPGLSSRGVPSAPEVRDAVAKAPGETNGRTVTAADGIDLTSLAMHTTGTVGENDRTIVAVLTLEATNVSWKDSVARITDLTKTAYAGSSS